MNTATQRLRRLGFRKWYERELLQSHAHLVMVLLCALGLLGSFEAYSSTLPLASQVLIAATAFGSAVIGLWALRRYLYLLNHAEYVADQAVCRQCGTYAKWDADDDGAGAQRLHVRCRRCGNGWHIQL